MRNPESGSSSGRVARSFFSALRLFLGGLFSDVGGRVHALKCNGHPLAAGRIEPGQFTNLMGIGLKFAQMGEKGGTLAVLHQGEAALARAGVRGTRTVRE